MQLRNNESQLKSITEVKASIDIRQIQTALELYRSDNSTYPAALPGCGATWALNGITYMQSVPCDPIDKSTVYSYNASGGGPTYTLSACLENTNDQQSNGVNC